MKILNRIKYQFCYLSKLYSASVQNKTPYFSIPSHLISIIEDPIDFYLALKNGINQSSRRIGLSSLYMGTGPLQRHLLKLIQNKAKQYPNIQTTMVFDYNRSNREQNGQSSIQMLSDYFCQSNPCNTTISFYNNSKRFGVFGEILGVHHQKIYIFDDRIIIGGANLSKNYFLNRKDRYFLIQNQSQLADYLFDYLLTLSQNCFNPFGNIHAKQLKFKNQYKIKTEGLKRHYKLWKFGYMFNQYKPTIHEQQEYLKSIEIAKQDEISRSFMFKQKQSKALTENRNQRIALQIGTSIKIRDPSIKLDRQQKKQNARSKLFNVMSEDYVGNELMQIEDQNLHSPLTETGKTVYIFPFINFPLLGETYQPHLMSEMVKIANNKNNQIRISSGYLNLHSHLLDSLFTGQTSKVTIHCSSPQANSFYRAGFFKKYIPYFYRCFEHQLLTKYKQKVTIKQFNNREWSYHSKGVWIQQSPTSYLTVLGSSNFNDRSFNRDSEIQFYFYSTCDQFNSRLNKQWQNTTVNCKQISLKEIENDEQIKCNWVVKTFGKLFKRFL